MFILIFFIFSPSFYGFAANVPFTFSDGGTLKATGGYFELGLFSKTPGRWYLGIWHTQLQDQILWVANREEALNHPTATLKILKSKLVLTDQSGSGVVWMAQSRDLTSNVMIQLTDEGNFVVKNSSESLWESFNFPTDTFLGGMNLTQNLTSWSSLNNPSRGNYVYEIRREKLSHGIIYNDGMLVTRIFPSKEEFSFSNNTSFYFLWITFHGILHMSEWNGSLYSVWFWPNDECDVYDRCQRNFYCNVADEKCSCIKGFVHASVGYTMTCVRETPLKCSKDVFTKLVNMKLPDFELSIFDLGVGLDECKQKCLRDCSCIAYAIADTGRGQSGCLMWRDDLVDMRNYLSGGQDLYVRLAFQKDSNSKTRKILLIVGGCIVFFLLLGLYLFKEQIRRIICGAVATPTNDSNPEILDYNAIETATNGFAEANMIGSGGFGSVFKGQLANGSLIAVKRLNQMTADGVNSFDNEINLIGLVQHVNIVRLIASFSDDLLSRKFLIYEYLEKMELERYLFGTGGSLLWRSRYDIATGIARGLVYLHEDSRFKIIHLDIKPSNILLSNDWIPKISDFGMARTLERHQTEGDAPGVVGTRGYTAPELRSHQIYSVKSDVCSFGVLLLEMISGKKNTRFARENEGESLISHTWKKWNQGNGLEMVDPVLHTDSSAILPENEAQRCIQIGLLCVQHLPEDRPTMRLVLSMLENEELPIGCPKPPLEVAGSSSTSRELQDDASTSVNRITLSVLGSR